MQDRNVIALSALCLLLIFTSCQSSQIRKSNGRACADIASGLDLSNRIETLNAISAAYDSHCDDVVVTYGAQARSQFRHKQFSVTREAANVFVPDGTFIEYVMESYERGFLSILLANSYLRMQKIEEAKVELRDLDHELFAPLYNYGEDAANLLLSAVLWEQVGEVGEARVDWLRLRDLPRMATKDDDILRLFASQRVSRIDDGDSAGHAWRVYQIARFPELEWNLQFTNTTNGYFVIRPKQPFMAACASSTGTLISTEGWFDKLAMRHSHAYHPLLNVQTWMRFPLGVVYSLVPLAAGAGVMVGGCVIDVAGDGKGALCQLGVVGGMAIMSTAPDVLEGALRPDLRHWEEVPGAFLVTQATRPESEPCMPKATRIRLLQ